MMSPAFDEFRIDDIGHPRFVMETVGALHRMGYGLRLEASSRFLDQQDLRMRKLWDPNLWQRPAWCFRIYSASAYTDAVITGPIPWLARPVITGSTPEEAAQFVAHSYREIIVSAWLSDKAYVDWYEEMLRLTAPAGILIESGKAAYIAECPRMVTITPFMEHEQGAERYYLGETEMRARRLMEIIGELHKLGYGKLKLYSYIKEGMGRLQFIFFVDEKLPSSLQEAKQRIFHWSTYPLPDYPDLSLPPHEAAKDFVTHHSDSIEAARGMDSVYVEWFAKMLKLTAPFGTLIMEFPDRVTISNSRIETMTPPIYDL